MRPILFFVFTWLSILLPLSCVDQLDLTVHGTVNVVVVDGIITNLAEPQIIRLNRSKADPFTGRFGATPITNATLEVIIDSVQVIACHETVAGSYQLPSDFKGQTGHAYQLRFTLSDGTHYQSTQQVMQPVPPIDNVSSVFNPSSLFPPLANAFTAGHDLAIDFKDPAGQRNYYRWDWKLYEKQDWCRTCYQGVYSIYTVTTGLTNYPYPPGNIYSYTSGNTALLEDCYYELTPPFPSIRNPVPEYKYDYNCRSDCWEIIYSYDINVFDDQLTNGGQIAKRVVAHIPFYDHNPALVEIRQTSLTPDAYAYFKKIQDQTQNTGGVADTPPSVPIGNVHKVANQQEAVIGYFTASAIAPSRYWLDRKDVSGLSLGGTRPGGYSGLPGGELFYALNIRDPKPEPSPPQSPELQLFNGPPRPPTAVCAPSESKTPYKPEGWQD